MPGRLPKPQHAGLHRIPHPHGPGQSWPLNWESSWPWERPEGSGQLWSVGQSLRIDLDELRLGQAQDEDAGQVGHGHSCEHLGVTGGRQAGHGAAGRGLGEAAHPLTALPMEMVASLALSSRVGLVLMAKERVIWDTNSTEMPTACGERGGFSHKRAGAGVSTQTSGQHLDSRKSWGRPMRPAPLLPWSPAPSASRLP